uniref:Uncharacterized protein n=1 Tax=Arion vulgaris TaxID=1028688 RepID=A0A0B7BAQ1_9EUPU
MKSMTTYFAFLLIFCTQFYQVKSDDVPKIIADFMCTSNGYYDDGTQISEGDAYRDYIQSVTTPVTVPAFDKSVTILGQGIENGKLRSLELIVLNVTGENTITAIPYNFTAPPNDTSTASIVKHLLTLKREDFSTNPDCQGEITHTAPYVFTTQWPECIVTKNNKHPAYRVTVTCNDITFSATSEGPEKLTLVDYDMRRRGLRFPLIYAPDNYVCECD